MGLCPNCKYNYGESTTRFCPNCGFKIVEEVFSETTLDPFIGKVLEGKYHIVSLLGEGGMGKVYLAEQRIGNTFRKVAIKVLHVDLARDPEIVARFYREAEIVVQLTHPNTIMFYDFGRVEKENFLYIVMEYVEGESLEKVIEREGPIHPQRAIQIVTQICGSLNEAHQHGIIHRDLKPDNIVLTERGGQKDFVKVLDFGIARKTEYESERQNLTRQGTILGTPPYMSPEQFLGKQLDLRSDIYSLGVVCYEMLTGRLPFVAKTPWEWATKHLSYDPAPIPLQIKGYEIPLSQRQAIMRALSKEPEKRQSTVMEFLSEFVGKTMTPSQILGMVNIVESSDIREEPTDYQKDKVISGSQRLQVELSYDEKGEKPKAQLLLVIVVVGLFSLGVISGGALFLYHFLGKFKFKGVSSEQVVRKTEITKEKNNLGKTKGQLNPEINIKEGEGDAGSPPLSSPEIEQPKDNNQEAGYNYIKLALENLRADNYKKGVDYFLKAQKLLPPSDDTIEKARREFATTGYNKIGLLVMQAAWNKEKCKEAITIYRLLKTIKAEYKARSQFNSSICKLK